MDTNKVAIIGAGPAGLTVARSLKLLNIPFQIYEKHSEVGGIWDITNAGTPMYQSAHFISSKTMSGHLGFPMPDDYPDYPSRIQIHQYIQNFAQVNGLYEHIRFNTKIKEVVFKDGLWQVQPEGAAPVSYRWLVCASGSLWDPNRPRLKGEEQFEGEVMHAVKYKNSDYFRNKRVLVVGAGNSGVDIACDAAFMAQQAFISMRRGYHFVPKHIFGIPADVFAHKTGGGPMWLSQWVFGKMLRLLTGNLTRLGLQKPDHSVMSSHPIMNSQLLHYLQHGDVIAKRDIDHLTKNEVVFKDGSTEEVDLIILATGYKYSIPYLDKAFFEWKSNRPQLYLKMFNPQNPTLFASGYLETNGGIYGMLDQMAYLIAKSVEAQLHQPALAKQIIAHTQQPPANLGGAIKFVSSDRHTGYVDKDTYLKALKKFRKKWGWESLESVLARTNQPKLSATKTASEEAIV